MRVGRHLPLAPTDELAMLMGDSWEGTTADGERGQLLWMAALCMSLQETLIMCGHSYDLKEDKWTELPDCPQKNAGLAVVSGLLTAVGGMTNDSDATNTLVSLTESHSKWTEHFPPMPVKSIRPSCSM